MALDLAGGPGRGNGETPAAPSWGAEGTRDFGILVRDPGRTYTISASSIPDFPGPATDEDQLEPGFE